MFIRQYTTLSDMSPTSYNPYKELDIWINFMNFTDKDYISVEVFGNGFRFIYISDIFNIMED